MTVDVNGTVTSGLATPAQGTFDAQIFNPDFVVDFKTNSADKNSLQLAAKSEDALNWISHRLW